MYSQSKEEEVILEYFKDHVGTFISLGENDGLTFSNVRALAERGWTGVMIEPDPEAFARLQKLYEGHKGLYTYNYAISDTNGKKFLQKSDSLLKTGDTGLVSTFNASEMKRFHGAVNYTPVPVQVYTWGTARNRWSIRSFDFISIDIESDEMRVLPDIDLTNTKMLCIEHNGSKEKKEQYLKCTSVFGMNSVIYESAENLIIVR